MPIKTLALWLCLAAAPVAAQTVAQQNQTPPSQNQSQVQTNQAQQAPQAKTLPPDAAAQNQPNPLPAAGSK